MTVVGDFSVRGGIKTAVTADLRRTHACRRVASPPLRRVHAVRASGRHW